MIFLQNIVKLSVVITFNIKLFGKGLIQIKFIYINAIPIHISTKSILITYIALAFITGIAGGSAGPS